MTTRRQVLTGATAAAVCGLLPRAPAAASEPPPEVSRIVLFRPPSLCVAPTFVAEELLRTEGFTDIKYVPVATGLESSRKLAAGEADVGLNFAAPLVLAMEAGHRTTVLAGVHSGCLEVVARQPWRTMHELKGKRIAVWAFGSVPHVFMAAMLAHVGLDPARDVEWRIEKPDTHVQLFMDGKVDVLLVFPPLAQDLRARKIGHVVVATVSDRPWSQYFCCMVEANGDFVRKHPVATRRVLRALLKATNLCSAEPETAARILVDKGHTVSYPLALQTMKELPYDTWRRFDAEDSLRYYALRLHEARMIKSNPRKLIARGVDWRFVTELKKELKG